MFVDIVFDISSCIFVLIKAMIITLIHIIIRSIKWEYSIKYF